MNESNVYDETFDLTEEAREFAKRVKRSGGLMTLLGILIATAGVMVIARPLFGGVAVTVLVGAAMFTSGLMQVVLSFRARIGGGFFGLLGAGLVMMAGGVAIFFYPLEGLAALTAILGAVLLIVGAMRVVFAIKLRALPGSGGILLNGVLAIALGVMLFARFPESSEVVIGIFLGVDLIMNGMSLGLFGSTIRGTMKRAQDAL